MHKRSLLSLVSVIGLLASPLHAAEGSPTALPTAEISVESSRSAPNDQFRAQLYHEASDSNPAELARKVNTV
ncbi:MAG: cyclic nucleotide-binding protein, partial [Zoogloea sp.]|nr:cyclic nucleotide-binding protein [Zoogloea sp.]